MRNTEEEEPVIEEKPNMVEEIKHEDPIQAPVEVE